jgi:hypothetical protein
MICRSAAAPLLAVLSFGLSARAEPAVDVGACTKAYDAGQEERLAQHREEAIAHFNLCSNPSCPAVVVEDCSRWLREAQAEVAAESQPPAFATEEPTAVAVPEEAPRPDPAVTSHAAPLPRAPAASEGVPTGSVVLGAVALVSFGVGAGFGISASSDYHRLEESCAPNCEDAKTRSVSRKLLVADIALVTGAVALGAAVWVYVARGEARTVSFGVVPAVDGAHGQLRATF